jgi:O-antigen/teichoic acid export membrane protein
VAVALRRVVIAFGPPQVVQPVLIVLILAGFVLLGHPGGALAAITAAGVARLLILLWQGGLLKRGGLPIPATSGPIFDLRIWMAVGAPLLLFDMFSIILRQADLLMIGVLMSPADAGIYGAALKTTGQTIFLLASVNAVIAPMLSSMYAKKDMAGLQRLLYMAVHLSFWPALIFVAALIFLANFILGLFGPAFLAARTPMIILGIGQLFNAGTGVVISLLIVTGYHKTATKVYGISAGLYLILAYIGIHFWGLIGAAVATALIMALWNIWLSILAYKRLGLHTSIIAAALARTKRSARQ